jgi:hypothetical protein
LTTPQPTNLTRRGVALVVGNAAYRVGRLRNPVNDATAVADRLRQLGFEVMLMRNASLREMEEAIDQLSRRLRQGLPGLFYFAGHGVQIAAENYLIPLGARIDRQQDVRYEAMPVGRVLGAMEDARNVLNIVILDACRNNPFARRWRSAQRGLALVQAASGSLIAYATAPGKVTADGRGRNSVYTHHLLRHMTTPGLSIEQVFKQVRIAVMEETDGQQTPWESSSLTVDFHLVPPTSGNSSLTALSSASSTPNRPDPEATMWALVEQSSRLEDFIVFLRAFPYGRFALPARLRLQQLQRQTKSVPLQDAAGIESGTRVAVGLHPTTARPEVSWPKTSHNSIGMEFVLIPAGTFTPHGAEQPALLYGEV